MIYLLARNQADADTYAKDHDLRPGASPANPAACRIIGGRNWCRGLTIHPGDEIRLVGSWAHAHHLAHHLADLQLAATIGAR